MNRQQRRQQAHKSRRREGQPPGDTTLERRLDDALRLHQRGEFERAEAIYRNVLRQQPDHADALHLLGVLRHQCGASEEARELLERALENLPSSPETLYNLADILLAQGKPTEAIARFQSALSQRPDFAEARISLGVAYRAAGEMEKAINQLREATEKHPDYAEAHYNLGDTLRIQNDVAGAQAALAKALEIRTDFPEAANNLATILRNEGDIEGAARHIEKALHANPDFAEGHNNLGNIRKAEGSIEKAIPHFEQAVRLRPEFAEAHCNLGNAYLATGRTEAAIDAFKKALSLSPDLENARGGLSEAQQRQVPRWHFAMMNDHTRNEAYDQAIRESVSKDTTVLDIGAGAGLLSMMAARAGATHVTACEAVEPIAKMAGRIVKENNLADRITILPKHSYGLKIGDDLPERADMLVTELLNAGFLGEGILQVIAHARANLLKPDATILPKGGTVYAMLVESERLFEEDRTSEACGFDMRLFNEFASAEYLTKRINAYPHKMLSDSVEVFSFDFLDADQRPEAKEIAIPVTADGVCHAVLLWFRLNLTDTITLETKPRAEDTHWRQAIYLEAAPRRLQSGDACQILAQHDCRYISLKLTGE